MWANRDVGDHYRLNLVTSNEKVSVGKGQERKEGQEAVYRVNWGVLNPYITSIYVGHSPIRDDVDGSEQLEYCLKSVMPHLKTIESGKGLSDIVEHWKMVQQVLVRGFPS